MASFTYDVFLSFRGDDTRYGFTGHLRKALDDKGVRTFMDDDGLQKGDEITPSLLKAIEHSKIAIVVLSKNYASSSFCLQELSKILDSINGKDRSILPVFYKVDPSDVRKLKRSYGEAMDKHDEDEASSSTHNKWKMSLHQVANLSGFHYKKGDGYEHEFIAKIVEQVLRKIKPEALPVDDYLVGLEPQKQHLLSLLNVGCDNGVRMVGIHGIGGIGKTTLALAVYNSIAHQFEGSCFLENVRENSEKHGLPYLQMIFLSKVAGEKIELTGVLQGISIIQQRLRQKKLLLIIDDVNEPEQLQAIAGRHEWFAPTTRIIITARDKRLLTNHGVESTYEVKELNYDDSFKLLLKGKTFKSDKIIQGYWCVLERVINYASGIPLALEVISSQLFNKTIEQCNFALDSYDRRVPNKKIQMILQMSFDTLNEEEKSVFLDIACCFKGCKLAKVEKILHAHYGESKKEHINVLLEKSLIKISESGKITLHDIIEDMGKEIVRQESPKKPGKRTRLWLPRDIFHVLEGNSGTSSTEIIYLDCSNKVKWDGEAFKKMKNLKTLIIRRATFSKSPNYLPNTLRVLEWCEYPSSYLPCGFYPKKLVICNFGSCFTSNPFEWDNFLKKKFQNMRVLNFDHCELLTKIPDLSSLPNLDEFSFQNCGNLIAIDKSIGFLYKLKILRIMHCNEIQSVPPLNWASLVELNLSHCDSLESFPCAVDGFVGELQILRVISCSKIRTIPPLMLAYLEELDFSNCTSLESFPLVVDGLLVNLKTLRAMNCIKLRSIPTLKLASLEEIDLSRCSCLESFPPVVDGLVDKLKTMSVRSCVKLRSIPPLKLDSLEKLDLSHCSSLESFPLVVDGFLGKLKTLLVQSCDSLRNIPPLKLNSLEELDLSHCYNLESFPIVVDGLLDKLEILSIDYCIMLRSIPPLRLTSLVKFNLSYCLSLECFPEILGEMRNIPKLYLDSTPIKKLPFPFQNFTLPPTSYPCNCGIVNLPNRVAAMSMLAKFTIKAEKKVSPVQSSQVQHICLTKCKLSDEYLSIGLMLFANVKELHLTECQVTVLPKSIEKCHFLWRLVLDDCEELEEIKGIPPGLKELSALNCKSLTSSCKSKLLSQELHVYGNTRFCLPRAKIPEWFDHQWLAGLSTFFWFRNKFPSIVLGVVSPLTWVDDFRHRVRVTINGNTFLYTHGLKICTTPAKMYTLNLFHMQMKNFNDNMDKALLENKWNHAEVDFGFPFMNSGIHVLKEKSSMKDIRFTNPEE
ncbi:disease resistance protein Roq1 isoform X2 [Lathyrus oleraceus]|uniref:disease resistance protein Roq1 isoform X2 n=1 Tax=Pisum sativum TaxID=3888 RepID=UPI0021CF7D89|nr:disease resistance protein Roq1-like isoform X2 [Pisum sativum]